MIQTAVAHLVARLDDALRAQLGRDEETVVAASLVAPDGGIDLALKNKVVVTVLNIEEETALHRQSIGFSGDEESGHAPSVHLVLHVLIAAKFESGRYAGALEAVSAVLDFFRRSPVFDTSAAPGIDPRIERLVIEPDSPGIAGLSDIWRLTGATYVPSVLYKVRLTATAD